MMCVNEAGFDSLWLHFVSSSVMYGGRLTVSYL